MLKRVPLSRAPPRAMRIFRTATRRRDGERGDERDLHRPTMHLRERLDQRGINRRELQEGSQTRHPFDDETTDTCSSVMAAWCL